MIAPDIAAVVALEPYVVRVVFVDGQVRDVDIEPLLDGEVFTPLRERAEFELVHIDEQSGAVTWPTGADLDPDVVYGAETVTWRPAAHITTPQPA